MTTLSKDRQKALDAALAKISKEQGAEAVVYLGAKPTARVETFSTGSLALDIALGVGGLPRGRIIEIYGPESSGKTTMALHAIASAQRGGGRTAFIDAEHALDPEYATALGINIDELLLSQPSNGEEALNIAETFVNSGAIDLIVIDSVAALVPKAELEGEMGASSVGVQARLMSQALRKLAGGANNTKCTIIFINQLREKIGVMFGSPETTTGGKALKFYASVRLDIRRIETLKEGVNPVGNRVRIKVVKNKVAPPFKQAETDIMFGKGFSLAGDILELGVAHSFIRKSGSWFTDPDTGAQLGQGKENSRQFLIDNPEYASSIEQKVRDLLLPEKVREGAEDEAGETADAEEQGGKRKARVGRPPKVSAATEEEPEDSDEE